MASRSRHLNGGETSLVKEGFSERLPYAAIRLVDGASANPIAMTAFANGNTAITLRRSIYFSPRRYTADFSQGGPRSKELLLHEMTHVWQYSSMGVHRFLLRYGRDLAACGFKPARMYEYQLGRTPFNDARLEAQAQMVGDYCHALAIGNERWRERLAVNLGGSGIYGL